MYNLTIMKDHWLYGAESKDLGFMYSKSLNKYDILGFILVRAGYTAAALHGYRTPSQFAQKTAYRGDSLTGIASFLTTTTHADTPACIDIGKLNDNINVTYEDLVSQMTKLLSKYDISLKVLEIDLENAGALKLLITMFTEMENYSHSDLQVYLPVIKSSEYVCRYFVCQSSRVTYVTTVTDANDKIVYIHKNPNIGILNWLSNNSLVTQGTGIDVVNYKDDLLESLGQENYELLVARYKARI